MEEKLNQVFVGSKYPKLKKKVFSFPAFLFGTLYFAYRKMVVKAFILAAILTLLDMLTAKYASGGMFILTYLCIHISIGLYFPLWYRSFYTKSVRKIIEKHPNASEDELIKIALNQGGTNKVLVVLFAIFVGLLSMLYNSHINKPNLPVIPNSNTSYYNTVDIENNDLDYTDNFTTEEIEEDTNNLTGEVNLLTNQKVMGYGSSMGTYEIYFLDFDSNDYTKALRISCDEETYKTLSLLKNYSDSVKVEVRIEREEEKISLTSYKMINALTDEELTEITDEDSLRILLGLKTSGEYEEELTLKEDLSNGSPAIGFEDGNGFVEYSYSFEDEEGNTLPLDYKIYNGTVSNVEELIIENKYKVKYTVIKGTFGYEFNMTSFELIQ